MTAPLRLAVFDVDGTLIDSQHHIVLAMEEAFNREALAVPTRAEALDLVGLSLQVAMRRLVPVLPEARVERLVAGYRESFASLRATVRAPLFPGALEALAILEGAGDLLLGIATGKSRRGVAHMLELHGLGGRFQTIQVADDHPSKPHPSMLEAAMRETGAKSRHTTMIGDTTYDIEMARAAGVRAIGVGWGYHSADRLMQAGAEWVVDRFDQIPGILSQREAA